MFYGKKSLRFKPGLGIWACFLCVLILPFSIFASNKGLVGQWKLSQEAETLGENLVTNNIFESNISNWTNAGSAPTFERNTSNSISGTGDLHWIGNAAGYSGAIASTGIPFVSGKTYKLSFIYRKVGASTVRLKVGDGASITSGHIGGSPALALTATANTLYETTFTSTETATGYLIFHDEPGAAGEFYVDNIIFKEIVTADATPYNNNGSLVNGPTYTTDRRGRVGQALAFDGVDDYVEIVNNGMGKFDVQEYTISSWFKSDTDPDSAAQTIWSYDYTSHSLPYYSQNIRLGGSSSSTDEIFFGWNNGSISQYIEVSGALTDTQTDWHHVVAIFKSGDQRLYLDGNLIGSSSQTGTVSYYDQEVWVGKGNYVSPFDGTIADVRFYDRALSATEVAQLYNGSESGASTGSLQKGLVSHWPLTSESKKSSTVVADTTPNNNNGTISGATVRNQGYKFDGVDDMITTSGISGTTNELTQVYWIKKDALTDVHRLANGSPYESGFTGATFFAHTTTSSGSDTNVPYSAITGFTSGTWHMLVITRDTHSTNQVKVYLDGVLKLTGSLTNSANGTMTLGNFNIGTNSQSLDASIADVRLYTRVLSDTEITNLYNGADIPGAIGHWPLSSGAGDVSGNGHNGTVNGATLVGEAASFSGGVGSGDMISLQTPLEIDLTSFTLGFWVKRDSLTTADATNTNSYLRILEGGQYYKFLDYGISSGKFRFVGERDQNSAYWASVTTNVDADTEWHYVVISGDNNVVDVYMDGIYQGTDDDSAAGYTSNTCTISSIGKGYSAANASYGSYFAGEIKGMKYYDRPLSATEIKSLYDQGHAKQQQASLGNLNKGLVGYWPLSRKYTKDETVGSEIMADVTPYGNDGQNYGATVESGYTAFDGVNDKIDVSSVSVSNMTEQSISYWVNVNTIQSGDHKLVAIAEAFNTELQNGKPLTYFYSGGWHTFDYPSLVETGQWYHFFWSFNNGIAKLYINGVLVLEESLNISVLSSSYGGANKITIGARHNGSSWLEFFDGNIADVRLYDRVLSDREVKMLYDKGR